jgi:osmotically-inducible protein OsmY
MTKRSAIPVALFLLMAWPLPARTEEGASGGQGATTALPAQDAGAALDVTVEQAWTADQAVPAYLLAAKLRDGKLQLFGAVENAKQHGAAVATARKLAGDTPVVDHIEVTDIASQEGLPSVGAGPAVVPPQDVPTGLDVTVEEAWTADQAIPVYLLAAKLRDGRLQLFGAVETPEQRASAVAIAKRAAGDVPVVSHIAVKKIASLAPGSKPAP